MILLVRVLKPTVRLLWWGEGEAGGSQRMAELPFSGVTVVSIEQAVAAPSTTRQLADLGARAIVGRCTSSSTSSRKRSPPVPVMRRDTAIPVGHS